MPRLKNVGIFVGGALLSIVGFALTLYITGFTVQWSLKVYNEINELISAIF